MIAKQPPSLSVEEYRQLIDDVLKWWFDMGSAVVKTKKLAEANYVFGLVANAFAKAEAALVLWDRGYWSQSIPLVRACFESAVTAAWAQQTGQAAINAIAIESTRQSTNVLDTAAAAGLEVPDSVRQKVLATTEGMSTTEPVKAETRSFQAMCNRFGGHGLYLRYRHLSGKSHAGGSIANHLKATEDEQDLMYGLRPDAPHGLQITAAASVAESLVWAGRAYGEVVVGKPGKKLLQQAAKKLVIPRILIVKR